MSDADSKLLSSHSGVRDGVGSLPWPSGTSVALPFDKGHVCLLWERSKQSLTIWLNQENPPPLHPLLANLPIRHEVNWLSCMCGSCKNISALQKPPLHFQDAAENIRHEKHERFLIGTSRTWERSDIPGTGESLHHVTSANLPEHSRFLTADLLLYFAIAQSEVGGEQTCSGGVSKT